jgi:hypothetical protein
MGEYQFNGLRNGYVKWFVTLQTVLDFVARFVTGRFTEISGRRKHTAQGRTIIKIIANKVNFSFLL